ncbi:MlaD family protein [Flavobacterium terrigena]|uniref:Phospholipid/cholesterol/gamma-HCH transport system substrate-binding protein n=1 Tax=Flavobacterium terrigena TaxID=402734 RepID=A0A1H6W065_9FLAO|nr:MlaD family protein [Flavobacterium terrigena]SEJ10318.1 phospholipid/cholesterol/gamma-HCH transport system substrate-binding protein [Flavobacterium terrigena]
MKITREIKVAVLVILSIVLFYWGFTFLKGRNLFDSSNKLYAVYDNVAGLVVSAPVTINGLTIGKVNSIEMLPDGKMNVELVITNEQIQIAKSSIAQIKDSGLIGGREIAIINNFSDKNYVESGDTLKTSDKLGLTAELANQIGPVKDKVEILLENANKLIENLNTTLDATTQQKLKSAIASLEVTMAEFSQASKNINGILADTKPKLNTTLSNFEKTSANLNNISTSLDKADLGATVKKLDATLASVNGIMANLEQGKGTMGKLLHDDAMYTNLTKTSKELELLLQDLRLHPTRYVNVSVFGKKNKPYVAPATTEPNIEQPKN